MILKGFGFVENEMEQKMAVLSMGILAFFLVEQALLMSTAPTD